MNPDELVIRRILTVADASSHGCTALDFALELAAEHHAWLQGLFVEDIDLFRLASLPCAWEITATSATRRRLELTQLERALREQAEQVQRHLAEMAQQARVAWSFQIVRGHLPRELLNLAEAFDVCIIGRESPVAARYLLRREAPAGRTVVALAAATPTASRALRLAARLSRRRGHPLLALFAKDGGMAGPEWEQLRNELATAEWRAWSARNVFDLKQALAGQAPAVVMLDMTHPLLENEGLSALLAELACTLLLVH